MHTLGLKGVRGMAEQARLIEIKRNRKITKEADSQFLFEYQRAILLSLKDSGVLDETQYQYAEKKLKDQLQVYIRQNCAEEGGGAL